MSSDLSGFSMFELFKEEAATHAATLSSGLISVEADQDDPAHFESLMRAAHSIKGAARIVGLDVIVEMAHAMEDCFVALQGGQQELTAERVDQLLKGVDLIQELADLDEAAVDAWSESHQLICKDLAHELSQPEPVRRRDASDSIPKPVALTPELTNDHADTSVERASSDAPAAPVVDRAAPERGQPSESAPTAPKTSVDVPPQPVIQRPTTNTEAPSDIEPASARTVPVNSENLNRIMRLASESMLESRRLQSLGLSLGKMRDLQRQILELNDRLCRADESPKSLSDLQLLRDLGDHNQRLLQTHCETLEQALWRSERTSTALYHEVLGSRMRPFVEGTVAFPRMIRDLSRSLGKQVTFEILGQNVAVDRDILRKLEAPLNHILRNCVDHAIEFPADRVAAGKPPTGVITLHARHHAGMLSVEVRDDGRGIDPESLRRRIVDRGLETVEVAEQLSHEELWEFLFLPGFSTASAVTEISGRGVGLDVVRTMVQGVSGSVVIDSSPGQGTVFCLRLPVTLSVVRAVVVDIGGEPYAFPLSKLSRVLRADPSELSSIQGKQQLQLNGRSVGLVRASEILALPDSEVSDQELCVIVFGPDDAPCGLVVDRFCGEQDLVVRPLDPQLGKVQHISAAAVNETGQALLFVDVEDLYLSLQQKLGEGRIRGMTRQAVVRRTRLRILVVDDSVTVREVERQILVQHGYDVDVAVDGQDGLNQLRSGTYDLLITDVDMPRMNGIALIQAIRAERQFEALPIVVVSYKDREEDRMAGLNAGANAYLTKGSFHDDSFITTVVDLIGECH